MQLKGITQLELHDKFDCVTTPNIDDFDIRCEKRSQLISQVKLIAIKKKFQLNMA